MKEFAKFFFRFFLYWSNLSAIALKMAIFSCSLYLASEHRLITVTSFLDKNLNIALSGAANTLVYFLLLNIIAATAFFPLRKHAE